MFYGLISVAAGAVGMFQNFEAVEICPGFLVSHTLVTQNCDAVPLPDARVVMFCFVCNFCTYPHASLAAVELLRNRSKRERT
jgi:hypothetical protein